MQHAEEVGYTSKQLMRMAFGRRLQAELIKRGWNQSDLARQAAKHMPDNRAFGRDLVSGYIRGRIFPDPIHMNALAKTFGTTVEDLSPPGAPGAVDPPWQTQSLGDGRVLLKVNQTVDEAVALKIMAMLSGSKNGQN